MGYRPSLSSNQHFPAFKPASTPTFTLTPMTSSAWLCARLFNRVCGGAFGLLGLRLLRLKSPN